MHCRGGDLAYISEPLPFITDEAQRSLECELAVRLLHTMGVLLSIGWSGLTSQLSLSLIALGCSNEYATQVQVSSGLPLQAARGASTTLEMRCPHI